jgi:surface carbohydrate biosynthesis protein (TIGR04326 family)
MRKLARYLPTSGQPAWLWPLIRENFMESINGRTAVQHLLLIELFDAALKELPKQRLGIYLSENQGWERAMIYAWRKYQHGKLVAVFHSTVRYWDLRYFDDPRTFNDTSSLAKPLPDQVAVNGPVARKTLLSAGFPKNRLVEVEAQRYLGLANGVSRSSKSSEAAGNHRRRLLVLGDCTRTSTDTMMRLLQEGAIEFKRYFDITVKAHPACPVSPTDYPPLVYQVTNEPLNHNTLGQFDIAYAANATSASLDAFLAGLPVVIMLDEMNLNFSPLRGQKGVRFVSTAEELLRVLKESAQEYEIKNEAYFWQDTELQRWRSLIGE